MKVLKWCFELCVVLICFDYISFATIRRLWIFRSDLLFTIWLFFSYHKL